MQEGLSAGKNNPAHLKRSQAVEVWPQVFRRDFAHLPNFPDITHQAAAVAAVVREQNQDWKFPEVMIHTRLGPSSLLVQNHSLVAHLLTHLPDRRTSFVI